MPEQIPNILLQLQAEGGETLPANPNVSADANGKVTNDANSQASRLSALERKASEIQQNQMLQNLLNDPDIQNVIRSKQTGQPIPSQSVQTPTPATAQPAQLPSLGELDPTETQAFANAILQKVTEGIGPQLQGSLGPLEQELKSLKEVLGNVVQQKLAGSLAEARQLHPDFNEFRQDIVDLDADRGNISPEELFLLAKYRRAKANPGHQQMSTEKPTHTSAGGAPTIIQIDPAMTKGHGGFRHVLDKTLEAIPFKMPQD